MKKLKFAASLLGLAMLGACSSDMPEIVDNVDNGEDKGMYLSIKVVGDNSTRDDQSTVETLTLEENLEKIQLFILDDQENLYLKKTIFKNDIKNGVAKFSVDAQTYSDMVAKYDRGAKMEFVIYANGAEVSDTEHILHSSTNDETWAPDNKITVSGVATPCFIMSNAEKCVGTFENPKNSDGTEKNPWLIKTDIKLSRLASRFEFGQDNKTEYTAYHENGLKMYVEAFDIETFAKSTFRIATFTADGSIEKTNNLPNFNTTNHTHYAPTTSFPYRLTEIVTNSDRGLYSDYDYDIVNTETGKYKYARPNTISTNYTFTNTKDDYKVVPFAVIKASFVSEHFNGPTGAASLDFTAGKDVYASNGIFIGGFDDFKALRTAHKTDATKKFKVYYDDTKITTDAEKTKIQELEDNYNGLLTRTMPSEYPVEEGKTAKTEADDIAWFIKALQAEVYSRGADGKYYTYYAARLIHNDIPATASAAENFKSDYWKYGVSRNYSYVLVVNSFKYLGNNGTGNVGDGPVVADLSDVAVQVSISSVKWKANFNNKWDL